MLLLTMESLSPPLLLCVLLLLLACAGRGRVINLQVLENSAAGFEVGSASDDDSTNCR